MNNSFRILTTACVFLVLLCYACASRPDEQIKLAADAMNQAMEQRAEQYAPGEWKSAKEAWDQAQDRLAKQQYASAATSFITAKARLTKARDIAKAERASMQKQVQDLQAGIATNYAAFKAAVTPARLAGAAKKEFQAACDDVDKRIKIVDDGMNQGDFIGAKREAQKTLQAIEYFQKKLLGGATRAR
ncbi:MAG: hypothetical protein LAP85_11895 [Acidobacteriia bacterium]|nr:hypothetical protein [Terriglobia bacterium]